MKEGIQLGLGLRSVSGMTRGTGPNDCLGVKLGCQVMGEFSEYIMLTIPVS